MPETLRAAGDGQAQAKQDGPERDDDPGPEVVLQMPGQEIHQGLGKNENRKDARRSGPAPSEFLDDGEKKNGKGIPDPEGHSQGYKPDADHHPSIKKYGLLLFDRDGRLDTHEMLPVTARPAACPRPQGPTADGFNL
jgi:hypothetical protein